MIKDEKLQYNINRKAAKISALWPGKIDKYGSLTGGKILPSNRSRIMKQAKLMYAPIEKAFENQTRTIEEQFEKQTKALEDHGK